MTDENLIKRLRHRGTYNEVFDNADWNSTDHRIQQLTAKLDELVQTSAILCDDCGWAMKFPNFGCVYCGFHRLEKERDALTAERDGLLRCVTDNHVALCRAEAAEAERDGYRKALERIAGVKGPYSHPFPESNEGYGSFAIVTAREALKGESHD